MMNEISTTTPEFIFHLVKRLEFLTQVVDNSYTPLRFKQDGFIHCTNGEDLTVLVANDYFPNETDLLVLKIRFSKIKSKVLFETKVPNPGGKDSPLKKNALFPHIYGFLNLDSIEGIARLPKINYVFHFPKEFYSYSQFKEGRL